MSGSTKPKMKLPPLKRAAPVRTLQSDDVAEAQERPTTRAVAAPSAPLASSDRFKGNQMAASPIQHDERIANILDVIGSYIGNDRVQAETLAGIAEEAETSWQIGNMSFYDVGFKLLEFEEIASEEGGALAINSGNIFAIEKTKLSMLRTIAKRVREGALRVEECPNFYSLTYMFASMPLVDIEKARTDGLLRPTVKAREIQEWKTSAKTRRAVYRPQIETSDNPVQDTEREIASMQRKRRRLASKVAELDVSIEKAQRRLVKLRVDGDVSDDTDITMLEDKTGE